MADNQLNYQINIGGNAGESVGSLKKQLREATAEVAILSDKFGATSKEAIEAAKRAAELRDRIGDAKALTDAFNPDAKFKALTASLSGVAGGFAAVQGAIGLFGGESKELEKQLLKVQSALALSQGLQSIGESIDSFKQLGAVIQSTTIFTKANQAANVATAATMRALGIAVDTTAVSFRVLKGVIAATGIGLAVIAIGELISAISTYTSAADKAIEKQKELNAAITKSAEGALQAEIEQINRSNDLLIAQAKLRGASEKEIFEIEQSSRKLRIEARNRFNKDVANADKEAANNNLKEIRKEQDAIKISDINFQTEQNKRKEEQNKKEEENRNKNFELLKQRNEKESAAQKVQIDAFRATLSQREQDVLRAEDELEEKKATLIKAGNLNFEIIEEQHRLKLLEINSRYDKEEEDRVKARNERESTAQKIQINSYRATLSQREQDILSAEDELEEKRSALIRSGNYDFEKIEEEHRLKLIEINSRYDIAEAEKKKLVYETNLKRQQELAQINAVTLEEQRTLELQNLEDQYNKELLLAITNGENIIALEELLAAKKGEINQKYVDLKKQQDEQIIQAEYELVDAKFAIASAGINLVGALVGQNEKFANALFAIDKALAISKVIVDAIREIAAHNAVGATLGPLAPAYVGPKVVATKLRAAAGIATIAATTIAKFKGGSASANFGQGGAINTTGTPIIPTQQTQLTQLNQQSINAIGNSAIRAYVVETDITSNQKRIQAIKQKARFS